MKSVTALTVGCMCLSSVALADGVTAHSVWKNQSNSLLTIESIDANGRFAGTFVNNADGTHCKGASYEARGHVDASSSEIAFAVSFTGAANTENCFTVTAWSGAISGDKIVTDWALAYASGRGDLSVIGGQDTFTRQP